MAVTGQWRAVVAAVDNTGRRCTITIPRLSGTQPYRDVRVVLPVGAPTAAFGATSVTVGTSSLTLRALQVGDEVLVGFLEGYQEQPVVLGRLA